MTWSVASFNEAEAIKPRNLMSRRYSMPFACRFNEAEAIKPRNPAVLSGKLSQVCCFNEAEAIKPRKRIKTGDRTG